MANRLVLTFKDSEGATRTWSFNYADADVNGSEVTALANAMVVNGSIYLHPPVTKVGAKIVVTTEQEYDIGG